MVVVAEANSSATRKTIPTIDLSLSATDRRALSGLLVEACEGYGIFKLINHAVPGDAISRVEEEAAAFFSKPAPEKLAAAPAHPPTTGGGGETTRFGYGVKNIGVNGDMGELEYLLLSANPSSVSQLAHSISNNPSKFSCAVNDYMEAVKNLACELLDLLAEGLCISDKSFFSRLISDVQSDSLFRINHYRRSSDSDCDNIGFGEHSDPQIMTILRSNDVGGLQISLDDGSWIPVSSDPTAFYIMIGDLFKVLTNGRFVSIRHRAVANTGPKPRMSMAYFGAPPLDAWISPLPQMVNPNQPCLYRPFTWAHYKSQIYSFRLAGTNIDTFKIKT